MNARRVIPAVVVSVLAAVGIYATALPASAYTSGLCWVSPDQYARLSVTRYAVTGGIQYHMDLNSSTPILGMKYYQNRITISGVTLPGTNDQYKNYIGTQTRTVRGYWTTSTGVTVSCAVTL